LQVLRPGQKPGRYKIPCRLLSTLIFIGSLISDKVYLDNIKLSQERLKNILSLQKQGLVTNNDVLRTKLIISDLELAVRKTDDNIKS
jgi:hypothetical protein